MMYFSPHSFTGACLSWPHLVESCFAICMEKAPSLHFRSKKGESQLMHNQVGNAPRAELFFKYYFQTSELRS